MVGVRKEKDVLGEVELQADALIGINSMRCSENFRISGRPLANRRSLVRGFGFVKRAAALANAETGALPPAIVDAIVASCLELERGDHDAHLICDMLEGSGGTSANMNVNEVLANVALIKLGQAPGDYAALHPNDVINMGQSTNDVVPTAIKLALHESIGPCIELLDRLDTTLSAKQREFAPTLRLGRTCLQDAQPMTLGQMFGGYAAVIRRHHDQLAALRGDLLAVPLGGTAVGTGFGVRPGYRTAVLRHLSKVSGLEVRPVGDSFDAMQNCDGFARLSAEMKALANTLWKIGNDLILLASGPAGGIGEICLPKVQAGSSIMPGKMNPVIPMTMCQVALAVNGNDLAVSLAAQQGLLDLNHYEMLIADRMLDSLTLIEGAMNAFATLCLADLKADELASRQHLRASSALATILVSSLGYDKVSELVRDAPLHGRSFVDHAIFEGFIAETDVETMFMRAATAPETLFNRALDSDGH